MDDEDDDPPEGSKDDGSVRFLAISDELDAEIVSEEDFELESAFDPPILAFFTATTSSSSSSETIKIEECLVIDEAADDTEVAGDGGADILREDKDEEIVVFRTTLVDPGLASTEVDEDEEPDVIRRIYSLCSRTIISGGCVFSRK
jgi:hypothetical protein